MGGQHVGDPVGVLVQFVVQVQHRAPGVAENGVDALLTEDLDENLRTVEQHVFPSSFS